ncbi:hypothetical protein WJX84_007411 [Apatococcus fuscideae]|uniref:Uncharacterized protein n=1 Tax=Apatococcus fuscideae TaxID=2026836 RepID=A0AAW1T068_9CHLO
MDEGSDCAIDKPHHHGAHSTSSSRKRRILARKYPPIRISLEDTGYEVIELAAQRLGWQVVPGSCWDVCWMDTSVSLERCMRLSANQRLNHFNGMLEICRKKSLLQNISTMAKLFSRHFKFIPTTFALPEQLQDLRADMKANGGSKTYILKPSGGCQGKGIRLVQTEAQLQKSLTSLELSDAVASHYIDKPLLLDGLKFDLRIYALVTSCEPLRIFLFKQGLVRCCTQAYQQPEPSNLENVFMHLTNHAVNRTNPCASHCTFKPGIGNKLSLAMLQGWMEQQGLSFARLWEQIEGIIVKCILSIQPLLGHNQQAGTRPSHRDGSCCFELLGYDIMVDRNYKAWLVEVNHSPSFTIDTPLDASIKTALIVNTLKMVGPSPAEIASARQLQRAASGQRLLGKPSSRTSSSGSSNGSTFSNSYAAPLPTRQEGQQRRDLQEAQNLGSFQPAFPSPDPAKQALYERLLAGASNHFQSSFQAKTHVLIDTLQEKMKHAEEEAAAKAAAEQAALAATRRKAYLLSQERRRQCLESAAQPMLGASRTLLRSSSSGLLLPALPLERQGEPWPVGSGKAEGGPEPKRMLKLTRVGIKVSGSVLPRGSIPLRAPPLPVTPRMRLRKRSLSSQSTTSPTLNCCLVTRTCLRDMPSSSSHGGMVAGFRHPGQRMSSAGHGGMANLIGMAQRMHSASFSSSSPGSSPSGSASSSPLSI